MTRSPTTTPDDSTRNNSAKADLAAAAAAGGDLPASVPTLEDLSVVLGVNVRTLKTWKKRGMPGDTGNYDPAACRDFLVAGGSTAFRTSYYADHDASGDEDDLARLHYRKIRAETLLEELKLAERRGELLDVETVLGVLIPHVTACRALLEQIPAQCVHAMPKGQRAKWRKLLRDQLRGPLAILENAADELADLAEPEN